MSSRLVVGAIATGSAIMLAGCQGGQDATQAPTPPAPVQARSPIPPVMEKALDVAAMARKPCELLTAQQAKGFGLDLPPDQLDGLLGTLRCKWTMSTRERETIRTVDVSMFTNNPTLETLYLRRSSYPYFELTEISGYPAIITRIPRTILVVTSTSNQRNVRASRWDTDLRSSRRILSKRVR